MVLLEEGEDMRQQAVRVESDPRFLEKRAEDRYEGLVESAVLVFRGLSHSVPVINISTRGTMIESTIAPRLGESVVIVFDGYSPMHAFVRWCRDGRIGLNFGHEMVLG
jgi:hypothetical protein